MSQTQDGNTLTSGLYVLRDGDYHEITEIEVFPLYSIRRIVADTIQEARKLLSQFIELARIENEKSISIHQVPKDLRRTVEGLAAELTNPQLNKDQKEYCKSRLIGIYGGNGGRENGENGLKSLMKECEASQGLSAAEKRDRRKTVVDVVMLENGYERLKTGMP
ncbi:hypothetical protein PIIN_02987 [Serendipita indica DSM 11827]|uniref:Uncharacterized protein n=1 Tax=Serendipita indica (strain DSM 11827) TaxID=1109443 RepID=G4U2E4_SERID|nr:hypothetical protein PIIN_02987 [Serendipita indica DSM 11827]